MTPSAMYCRQKVAQEGADALPARIVIVTGKSRSKEDDAGTAAKEAIVAILGACNSPFQVGRPHRACARITLAEPVQGCCLHLWLPRGRCRG